MPTRYVIKTGKFGMYFRDNKLGADLTLEDVKSILNGYENHMILCALNSKNNKYTITKEEVI